MNEVKKAGEQAKAVKDIADLFAKGTDADIDKVIADAPAIVKTALDNRDAAKKLYDASKKL